MMRRMVTNQFDYPFAWLDKTIEVTLNPIRNSKSLLQGEDIQALEKKLDEETYKVLATLKAQTFNLFVGEEIKVLAGQYDLAIQILLLQAKINADNCPDQPQLIALSHLAVSRLETLSEQVRQRYGHYLPELPNIFLSKGSVSPTSFKLLCRLSSDQIAILLKAADDTKLVTAKSMSIVFKTIVPYLSTKNKEHLSWDSMRSNSYHPEESDKAVAIEALEQMISAIKAYH